MNSMKNQAGITLIELLATLTILSFLLGIIYSVFSNGLQYSSKAKNTVSIQQEANYLLTVLKEQHEKVNSYTVTVNNDHKKVVINNSNNETFTIDNPNFFYKMCKYNPSTSNCEKPIEGNFEETIDSKNRFPIKIIIESSTNDDLTYEVKTILSRL